MMDAYFPNELVVHVASYHSDRGQDHNENNSGVGLRWRSKDSRWFQTAGVYRNSMYRQSVYAGVGFDVFTSRWLELSVVGGIVSGYDLTVAPVLLPEARVNITRDWAFAMQFLPKVARDDGTVLGFSVVRSF